MKTFTQIAVPHDDIVTGRLTMDIFAADLWRVAIGNAPNDYQDADLFFRKTFLTDGLKNILDVAKARLSGKSGDSVIQLQTPFGGGKTHTLIALYHKAKEWNTKVVVIEGSVLDPREQKLWEEIEKQLTGKIEICKGNISPGREKLIKIIQENSPVLILMDELLSYFVKASAIIIGNSDIASQSLNFMHELTTSLASIGNSMLVLTLPSSELEKYDEKTEKILERLQKFIGRVEKIYSPVKDEEIEEVIRKRLFQSIDIAKASKVVNDFIEYAQKEGMLKGDEIISYRNKFLKSYPFKPEVIETLYKRWGSIPTFQRTRGVLRILSLVIYDLLKEKIPFIRLGDFNLKNSELRTELKKHIGDEWESIISQDIISDDSGAKKVDKGIGGSYLAYNLGTVVSTTIFMLSHSGGEESKTNIEEIKLFVAYPSFESSIIDTILLKLEEKLFYLSSDGYRFVNQPNLNRLIISRTEVIGSRELLELEKKMIEEHLQKNRKFDVYIHPRSSVDIPDNVQYKIIILKQSEPDRDFLENHGKSPRVFRNVLFFLCVDENNSSDFIKNSKEIFALQSIKEDQSLNLTEVQRKDVEKRLSEKKNREYEILRYYYKKLYIPGKDQFKEFNLGIPTVGEKYLDKEIYDYLKNQGEIFERISPKVIKEKYLNKKEHLLIKSIYESMLKTPGEIRLVSKEVLIESIREGVKNGLFGFGYLEDNEVKVETIYNNPLVELNDKEAIIQPEKCKSKDLEYSLHETSKTDDKGIKETLKDEYEAIELQEQPLPASSIIRGLNLKLDVPVGQLSTVTKLVQVLKNKFLTCKIELHINVADGEMRKSEFEDKIGELIKQAGIIIIEEEIL